MIKVAIIDDHVVVRAGLKYVLASDPELEFVGEYGGGRGAAQFVSTVEPDVTLLDVRMPDLNGVEVLEDILAARPKARVVMLTTSDVEEDVYRSIEAGALGYVQKEAPVEEIIRAIRSAMAGDVYMSDEIRRIYETRKGAKGLTPREAEVLNAVADGLGNREIGARLGISENSVKMHLKRIFYKLGADDRTEAVNLAVKRGFLARR
ncbi:MAG: response regulator transcription factor [Kiritimatiellae bacterium]|jgi:DNA-binding NarL/FixJ family response regulator|nr:response regulator transcription factor [Kiritimatiellia bacterium]